MPDPGASGQFGPYLLMQYFGGLLVLVGLALAIYRGTRDRKLSPDQEATPGAFRWYFDGPLNAALQTMRDNYRVLCSIDSHVSPIGEEMRRQTELLREIKTELIAIKDIENRRR
jgi:hypothetical protein